MKLPNDVARCADALDKNCQWRNNCARWVYRKNGLSGHDKDFAVWANFAQGLVDNKPCEYQIRID